MTTRGAQKKIKFKRGLIDPGIQPGGLSGSTTKLPVTPVHGIFRSQTGSPVHDDDELERPCSSSSSLRRLNVPGPTRSMAVPVPGGHYRSNVYEDPEEYVEVETEFGMDVPQTVGGGEGEASDSSDYELYSPLDRANLKELSKSQVIAMWRTSEMDLRRQLSQALKSRDELVSKLKKPELHDPP